MGGADHQREVRVRVGETCDESEEGKELGAGFCFA